MLMLGIGSPDSLAVIELEDSALEGLTSAQQAFVRLVHSGLSNTEAYRRVYGQGERSDNALGVAAHTVAHDPKVQLKLKYLREKAEAQSSLLPRINREYVIDGIKKLADDEKIKANTRLAAYIALGKTREVNLFGSDPIEQPQLNAPSTTSTSNCSPCCAAWSAPSTARQRTSRRQKKKPRRLSQGLQLWGGSGSPAAVRPSRKSCTSCSAC
jgi:hypothetical protein